MKNKYIVFLTVILFGFCTSLLAQEVVDEPQQTVDPKVRAKVEAARIGLISNRLGLTPEQAEKFWPVYREFSEKRMEVRSEFQRAQRELDPNNPDPAKQQELIDLGLRLKQRELDLEKDYSGRILRVITAQQMISLRKAEHDFRQLIIDQLQNRRALQQRKEIFRENQRLKRNRN